MKNALTITRPSIKFWAFIIKGDITAPKMRFLCFKEKTNKPKFSEAVRPGTCPLTCEQNLGVFLCSNIKGVSMAQNCSICPQNDHPIDRLSQSFTIINFVVEGTELLIQAEHSGLNPQHAFALSLTWHQFKEALKAYMESHGDDYRLIAGGK